ENGDLLYVDISESLTVRNHPKEETYKGHHCNPKVEMVFAILLAEMFLVINNLLMEIANLNIAFSPIFSLQNCHPSTVMKLVYQFCWRFHGVVLVTFNSCLGPFGFMSTQDEVVSGSNGLKDQRLVIKWTHSNTALFGGDPNRITIFGQSAGSAFATYHLLNRGVEGLIKGGICESTSKGDSVCNCSHLDDTFLTNNISQDLLEFLRSVPAKDLDFASDKYHDRVSCETVTNTDYDWVKAGNSTKL
ncbi:COesterase and/or Abhydrolase 3 domain containing protein, partial [Asbolus verrucosus]